MKAFILSIYEFGRFIWFFLAIISMEWTCWTFIIINRRWIRTVFPHQTSHHRIGIEEHLKVNDFEILVDFDNSRAEQLHQFSCGLIKTKRAGPMSPMSPGKRHFRRT